MRMSFPLAFLLVVCGVSSVMAAKREIIDPAEAAKDPDFLVQGEYVGTIKTDDGAATRLGVQLVARGGGLFDAAVHVGGLPGAGWKPEHEIIRAEARREGKVTKFSASGHAATLENGNMTVVSEAGEQKGVLRRVVRQSPSLGAKPPAGAVVLFDGSGAENFEHGILGPFKTLMAGVTTKRKFNSFTLHLEFCTSWMPWARGQARSNSGLYLHDCYEIQVLDSFGLEGRDNECGGHYRRSAPAVNMCLPPLVWQTYDVDFTAPRYDAGGKKIADARATVRHNGVVIHDDLALAETPGRQKEGPAPRPFHLQKHGNKVQYRNIWLIEK